MVAVHYCSEEVPNVTPLLFDKSIAFKEIATLNLRLSWLSIIRRREFAFDELLYLTKCLR